MSSFGPDGISTSDTYRLNTSRLANGRRICLGFLPALNSSGNSYTHVKTNIPKNDKMCKLEYDGYGYASQNIHSSITFYTYSAVSTPYERRYCDWSSSSGTGIMNAYYSSDNYVVIVVHRTTHYTGGMLYFQAGATHDLSSVDILAYTATSSTSGAY